MNTTIEFEVSGAVPPKKDGANSMWGKDSEIENLIALRQAALRARGTHGVLRRSIELIVEVYLQEPESRTSGDLDNFITGICDGLQAARGSAKPHPRWNLPRLRDVHPSKAVAIEDDSAVVAIHATKRRSVTGTPSYRVKLAGEP